MVEVILVEPQSPGNIGSVCRAMKNFGFRNLILVNPCELDENAKIMAVHARDILDKAEIVESLDKLDFDLLIGTTDTSTQKDDYFLRMSLSPEQLRKKLEKMQGKVGILFGREDSGLNNKELEKCDFIVTIPTSREYKAMNLSHSVAVVLYELSKARSESKVRLASKKELDLIKANLSDIVDKADYPEEKRKVFNTMVSKIFGRALITGREANTLIGVLKKIKKRLK